MEHSFDVEVAEKFGVNAAILFKNIAFWCSKNKANDKNFYDGAYWTYNSVAAFKELFPYLSEKQIRTALKKLEEGEAIKTGNYNTDQRDRTTWYALTEYGSSIFYKGNAHLPKGINEDCQKGEPLPDSKPNNKPDKKTDSVKRKRKRKAFTPPALEEVKAYCDSRNNNVDPQRFIDYYEAANWEDSKGNKVRNWKQKIISVWERGEDNRASKPKEPKYVPSDDSEWDF